MPEQEARYEEGKKRLEGMETVQCGICTDIEAYYEVSVRLLGVKYAMREKILASSVGNKVLSGGRVIVLNNSVCPPFPAKV